MAVEAQKQNFDISPFVRLLAFDVNILFPILKTRFPHHAHIANILDMLPHFKDIITVYTVGNVGDLRDPSVSEYSEMSKTTWIVTICERADYGRDINISQPLDQPITPEIKNAFKTSKLFDWTKPYAFANLDPPVSAMIFELSAIDFKNQTTFNPCNFYYFEGIHKLPEPKYIYQEEGTVICVDSLAKHDVDEGAIFLFTNWKYSRESTLPYLKRLIKSNSSQGVYIDGVIKSGVLVTTNGVLGYLFTLREHRVKGFAKLACHRLLLAHLKNGWHTCSTVEISNIGSNKFHKSIGMTLSHQVDFVMYFGESKEKD